MYNDYYLQEISGKLTAIHNDLSTISTNQATINNSIKNASVLVTMIISVILIYKFIERCLR